ncbi:MAG: twin-arginine translocase subunit TatC [Candidatus Omnitrophica bacterium]|nr:twin-arginine translocase subunit TatC [Candidatus Omnitrophota bacterium]
MSKSSGDLSFFAHYEELRIRLIKCVIAFLVSSCLFYAVVDKVLAYIVKPVGQLVFTAPGEAFIARIMLALLGGLFLSLPVVLYQVWRFVAEGLKEHEARYARVFAPCSLLLFIIGGLFAYFIAVPVSLRFLLSFSSSLIVPMITIKNYISFVGTMLLAFGMIFELPLVLMFMAKVGMVSPAFLAQRRRYAIIIILTVSAIMTPPDVVTQLIMAVPLILLYEVGIIAARLVFAK